MRPVWLENTELGGDMGGQRFEDLVSPWLLGLELRTEGWATDTSLRVTSVSVASTPDLWVRSHGERDKRQD